MIQASLSKRTLGAVCPLLPDGELKNAERDPCLSFFGAAGEAETAAETDDVAFLFKFVELNILLDGVSG